MTNVQGRNSIDFTKYGLKEEQAGIDRKYFLEICWRKEVETIFYGPK